MSASLVGSEMCIRDSLSAGHCHSELPRTDKLHLELNPLGVHESRRHSSPTRIGLGAGPAFFRWSRFASGRLRAERHSRKCSGRA
eukprot:7551478-Alexandrium_andersonii.AAC.1